MSNRIPQHQIDGAGMPDAALFAPAATPPFFPQSVRVGNREIVDGGASLLDWFAGQALVGLLAGANTDAAYTRAVREAPPVAFRIAEAMVSESARRRPAALSEPEDPDDLEDIPPVLTPENAGPGASRVSIGGGDAGN